MCACLPCADRHPLYNEGTVASSLRHVLRVPAVCRASAVLGMDKDRTCALQEDHRNTARPADRTSDAYIHVREHIKRCLSKYYKV